MQYNAFIASFVWETSNYYMFFFHKKIRLLEKPKAANRTLIHLLVTFLWLLTLSDKVEKCLCIRFVSLSVCSSVSQSVCRLSNSHKYSWNVLELIYVIHIWYSMNRIENGMDTTDRLSTETHISFPIHNGLGGKKV